MGGSGEAEISTWEEGVLKTSVWFGNHHLRLHLVSMNVKKLPPSLVSVTVSPKSWARISPHM